MSLRRSPFSSLLSFVSVAADGRVAPSHTASGAIPTQTPSLVFAIPTIDEVMDIVMTPPTEDMVTQNSPPRRLFKKANRATMSTAHRKLPVWDTFMFSDFASLVCTLPRNGYYFFTGVSRDTAVITSAVSH